MIEIRTYVKKHRGITKLRNVQSAKSGKSRQLWERLVSTRGANASPKWNG